MKKKSRQYEADVRNDAQVLLSRRELENAPSEEQTYREGVLDKLDTLNNKVDDLNTKVAFTNGKVRWQEKMIYLAIGGLGVISILVLPLIFSLIQGGFHLTQ